DERRLTPPPLTFPRSAVIFVEKAAAACAAPALKHFCSILHHNLAVTQNLGLTRLNREIRRRTRVVGSFPDGNSALMLVCARLRHVAGSQWGNKKYMNMKHLEAAIEDASIAG
ncbi:TPA: transposase, partial [Clostridioides difficile]